MPSTFALLGRRIHERAERRPEVWADGQDRVAADATNSYASTSSPAASTIAPAPGISAACNAGADGMRTSGVARRRIGALRREEALADSRCHLGPEPAGQVCLMDDKHASTAGRHSSAIASSSSGASQRRSKLDFDTSGPELVSGPLGLE